MKKGDVIHVDGFDAEVAYDAPSYQTGFYVNAKGVGDKNVQFYVVRNLGGMKVTERARDKEVWEAGTAYMDACGDIFIRRELDWKETETDLPWVDVYGDKVDDDTPCRPLTKLVKPAAK